MRVSVSHRTVHEYAIPLLELYAQLNIVSKCKALTGSAVKGLSDWKLRNCGSGDKWRE